MSVSHRSGNGHPAGEAHGDFMFGRLFLGVGETDHNRKNGYGCNVAPRTSSACVHGMLPLNRNPARTEPTLPPAPTMPATAPSAFWLTKGTTA